MAQAQNDINIIIRPHTSIITLIDSVAARSDSLASVLTILHSFVLVLQVPNLVGNIRLRVSRKYQHNDPIEYTF